MHQHRPDYFSRWSLRSASGGAGSGQAVFSRLARTTARGPRLALHAKIPLGTIPRLTEREYFIALEYRVCRELAGTRDKQLRIVWCDGFLPEPEIQISRRHSRITGKVWIGFGGSHQELWDFYLLLGAIVKDRQQIDWSALLPGKDVTGWLSMDFEKKLMTLRPYAAYPDVEPAKTAPPAARPVR